MSKSTKECTKWGMKYIAHERGLGEDTKTYYLQEIGDNNYEMI